MTIAKEGAIAPLIRVQCVIRPRARRIVARALDRTLRMWRKQDDDCERGCCRAPDRSPARWRPQCVIRPRARRIVARAPIALSDCGENRMTIVKEGAVAPLIGVLRDGSPGARRIVARALIAIPESGEDSFSVRDNTISATKI